CWWSGSAGRGRGSLPTSPWSTSTRRGSSPARPLPTRAGGRRRARRRRAGGGENGSRVRDEPRVDLRERLRDLGEDVRQVAVSGLVVEVRLRCTVRRRDVLHEREAAHVVVRPRVVGAVLRGVVGDRVDERACTLGRGRRCGGARARVVV